MYKYKHECYVQQTKVPWIASKRLFCSYSVQTFSGSEIGFPQTPDTNYIQQMCSKLPWSDIVTVTLWTKNYGRPTSLHPLEWFKTQHMNKLFKQFSTHPLELVRHKVYTRADDLYIPWKSRHMRHHSPWVCRDPPEWRESPLGARSSSSTRQWSHLWFYLLCNKHINHI